MLISHRPFDLGREGPDDALQASRTALASSGPSRDRSPADTPLPRVRERRGASACLPSVCTPPEVQSAVQHLHVLACPIVHFSTLAAASAKLFEACRCPFRFCLRLWLLHGLKVAAPEAFESVSAGRGSNHSHATFIARGAALLCESSLFSRF